MVDLFGNEEYETITTVTKKVIKTTKTVTRRKKVESIQPTLFEDDIALPQVTLPKPKKEKVKKDEWIDPFATGMDIEKALKSKKVKLADKLKLITDNTLKILGKQKENTIAIKTREDFHNYISQAIQKGRIAIDTETNNSLDPITCKIMGLCLYYPGSKQAYIPINHVNPETDERLDWQLTEQDIKEELQRIIDAKMKNAAAKGWTPDFALQSFEDWYRHHPTVAFDVAPLIIMHNGKFDYKVIKCTCDIEIKPDWDTLIASKLIDENEKSAGLKTQYITKIDPSQEKYAIDHLFAGVKYAQVDPEIFALYAATDSMMTDKLYLWQKPIMESYPKDSLAGKSIYDLFHDVEMVNIIPTASMELNGVYFDKEYAERLRVKFDGKLTKIDAQINDELTKLEPRIAQWKTTPEANFKKPKADKPKDDAVINGITYRYCQHIEQTDASTATTTYGPAFWFIPGKDGKPERKLSTAEAQQLGLPIGEGFAKSKVEQLENPISMSSPTQLAILLYDILGCEPFDEDAPRSTGEEALEALKDTVPLCGLLLVRRGVVKLLDAFITSLPENVNPKTGKIHGSFNQYGAATGRFSSSEPNLQQIPSHEKSIRMLFRADPGYMLVGSDFSQQEPRLLSFYSRDDNMINAYKNGKDLYATIATGVYHMPYWDCMEHHEDGSPNPEGKKRRASCKAILLGIMYGRGAAAIAEQIHGTKEEAQQIVDNFYKSFPIVKQWMNDSLEFLKTNGYVEDYYGRRRRLTDILLPNYEVRLKDEPKGDIANFNPYLLCEDRKPVDPRVTKWEKKVADVVAASKYSKPGEMSNKNYTKLAAEALKDGVLIFANTGRKAQAERQCVNARIQGGAATMTKIAMNKIYYDYELEKYDYHMLIGVHDELIGQCKEEYSQQCAERLCTIMKTSVADIIDVPFKCDPAITHAWYEDEMSYQLQDTYKELQAKGMSADDAFNKLAEDNCEFPPEQIRTMLAFE